MNDILKSQMYYTEVCVCLPFQHELQSDCLRWWLSHPQVKSLEHPLWIGMCLPESWCSQLSLFCLKENIKSFVISEIYYTCVLEYLILICQSHHPGFWNFLIFAVIHGGATFMFLVSHTGIILRLNYRLRLKIT